MGFFVHDRNIPLQGLFLCMYDLVFFFDLASLPLLKRRETGNPSFAISRLGECSLRTKARQPDAAEPELGSVLGDWRLCERRSRSQHEHRDHEPSESFHTSPPPF